MATTDPINLPNTSSTAPQSSSSSTSVSSSEEEKTLDLSVNCKGIDLILSDTNGHIAKGQLGPLASGVVVKPGNELRIKTR